MYLYYIIATKIPSYHSYMYSTYNIAVEITLLHKSCLPISISIDLRVHLLHQRRLLAAVVM
jgi:hypothetical protein